MCQSVLKTFQGLCGSTISRETDVNGDGVLVFRKTIEALVMVKISEITKS